MYGSTPGTRTSPMDGGSFIRISEPLNRDIRLTVTLALPENLVSNGEGRRDALFESDLELLW